MSMNDDILKLQELNAELGKLYDERIAVRDKKIEQLTAKLELLYSVALESVEYVARANYNERVTHARRQIHNAFD